MKAFKSTLIALLAACAFVANAQQDVAGTWAGELEVAPEATLSIHFVLARGDDGTYSAVVTSPDEGGIKDVAASDVRFDDGRLTLAVEELSGAYEGRWEDGGFTGEWRQEGTALPLRLESYEAPVLSEAAKTMLEGSWVGELAAGALGDFPIVYRFETNSEGELIGFLDSPDQGAFGMSITDVLLENGELSFKVPQARMEYTAALTQEEMDGTWKQATFEWPLTMRRGEHAPPEPEISEADKARLMGSWIGTADYPNTDPIAVLLRFETDAGGRFTAYFDSPEQALVGLPVTELSVAESGELSLRVPILQAQFTGTLGGERIEGTLTQGANPVSLTLSPGVYTPEVHALELPSDAMQQLAGGWRGRLGRTDIIVRFETDADGVQTGSLEIPAQNRRMAVTAASLVDGELTFRIGAAGMEYTAAFSGDEAAGQMQLGPGNVLPVTLTRDRE